MKTIQLVILMSLFLSNFLWSQSNKKIQKWVEDDNWASLTEAADKGILGNEYVLPKGSSQKCLLSVLEYAIAQKQYNLAKIIIKKGVSHEATTPENSCLLNENALVLAVKHSNKELVEMLLKAGFPFNSRNKAGVSALQTAIANKDLPMVRWLAMNSATDEHRSDLNSDAQAALHLAVKEKNYDLASTLFTFFEISPNKANEKGEFPLFVAVENADVEMLTLLLNKNALSFVQNSKQETPFDKAMASGNKEIIKLFMDKKAADMFSFFDMVESSVKLNNQAVFDTLMQYQLDTTAYGWLLLQLLPYNNDKITEFLLANKVKDLPSIIWAQATTEQITLLEKYKHQKPEPKQKSTGSSTNDEPGIIVTIDNTPIFPYCNKIGWTANEQKQYSDTKMFQFVYSNVRYPLIAREMGIEGKVEISFIVSAEGKAEQFAIKSCPPNAKMLGEAALQAVEILEHIPQPWTPGYANKKPVAVQMVMPISFRLK